MVELFGLHDVELPLVLRRKTERVKPKGPRIIVFPHPTFSSHGVRLSEPDVDLSVLEKSGEEEGQRPELAFLGSRARGGVST